MAVEFRKITHNLMYFECYRRYSVHTLLKDSGIYFGQPPVLEYLISHGTCTQNELARAMSVSPASMAVSVKRMQKSGLVEKVNDSNDLRCNKITVTEKGRRQSEIIKSRIDELDKKIFNGFSDSELEQFNSIIERMNTNLSKGLPDKSSMFNLMVKDFKEKKEGDCE